jgi:hypothetical protein
LNWIMLMHWQFARCALGRGTRTMPRTRNGSRRDISQTRCATARTTRYTNAISANDVWMTLTRMHEDLLLDAHHLPAGKTAA